MELTIQGRLYDYPRYYDLVFGSDWKAEFDFLRRCFDKHSRRPVERLFEPACGTGRLLYRFAAAGYQIGGNDLNPTAIEFCNARLARKDLRQTAVVGDMTNFRLSRKVHAAFNTINSFRHLQTEQAARRHLRCMADGLVKGGLYVLGLHLTPTDGPRCESESWSARRGRLAVISRLWSLDLDLEDREERLAMTFDVYTPRRQFRLSEEMVFRTYTAEQFEDLMKGVPQLELIATYDFSYRISRPIEVGPTTEDVVFVLKKR